MKRPSWKVLLALKMWAYHIRCLGPAFPERMGAGSEPLVPVFTAPAVRAAVPSPARFGPAGSRRGKGPGAVASAASGSGWCARGRREGGAPAPDNTLSSSARVTVFLSVHLFVLVAGS